jgi:nucleotide-binding universal stress UspA family protein
VIASGAAVRSGVMVGFDGSAQATQALDWGLDESELRRSPLILCQVWHWPYAAGDEAGRRSLRMAACHVLEHGVECARNRAHAVQVVSTLCEGSPERRLVEMSSTAEVLVIGSRGLGDVARLTVGSVAERVASHAACPVVVVRGRGPLPRPRTPGPVVVGIDDSPSGEAAMGFAVTEALLRGLPLRVIRACAPRGGAGTPATGASAIGEPLRTMLGLWRRRHPDLDLRTHVVEGPVREVLLSAAEYAGLIVVGASPGRPGRPEPVGRWLLHQVSRPVAVVPPETLRPGPP